MNRYTDRVVMCRLLNLELLLQFGPRAWQAHIKHLEVAQERCKTSVLPLAKHCWPDCHTLHAPCRPTQPALHAFGLSDMHAAQDSMQHSLRNSPTNLHGFINIVPAPSDHSLRSAITGGIAHWQGGVLMCAPGLAGLVHSWQRRGQA